MTAISIAASTPHNQFTDLGDMFKPSQQDKRFKIILIVLLLMYLAFAIIVPFLEQIELPREVKEQVPPQLAKIMIKEKQLPPPEKPKEEPKPEPEPQPDPEEVKPEPKKPIEKPVIPVKSTREVAKEQAQNAGLAAMKDELFSMREAFDIQPTNTSLTKANSQEAKVERKMLAAKANMQNQTLAKTSVTQTVTSGELSTKNTQQIRLAEEEVLASAGAVAEKESLSNASGQRSEAAIRRTLEANKSRLYALYNRALRKDPFLQGKVMFEIIIQPNGSISKVSIKLSELNNAKLERQLTVVLRSIKFNAEDVATMATIWAIDFLPS